MVGRGATRQFSLSECPRCGQFQVFVLSVNAITCGPVLVGVLHDLRDAICGPLLHLRMCVLLCSAAHTRRPCRHMPSQSQFDTARSWLFSLRQILLMELVPENQPTERWGGLGGGRNLCAKNGPNNVVLH